MKLRKFLLISALFMFVLAEAFACYTPAYPPDELFMYRVCIPKPKENDDVVWVNPKSKENCLAWQSITSKKIPLKDIYEVVYKMTLEDFEKLYNRDSLNLDNKFSKWILTKDTSIVEFLWVAKTIEYVRSKVNSAWYYPTMDLGTTLSLEEALERALSSKKDDKLRDRYLLQAVRALVSLERYEDCMNLWIDEASKLPKENVMRQLIMPYIAGVEFRLKESGNWLKSFAQVGDVESIQYCSAKSGAPLTKAQGFSLMCKNSPNNAQISELLQSFIRELERDSYELDFPYSYGDYIRERYHKNYNEIYSLSLEMIRDKRVKNKALWYYTLAFLSHLNNRYSDASCFLSKAENLVKDDFLEGSIKVLRIYVDAKFNKYDSAYEAKLFEQLRWLDDKIANNITKEVEEKVAEGTYDMQNGISFYYWNDMLRRIILSVVAPRMIEAGKPIRALQLANMADNRLFSLVNKYTFSDWKVNEKGEYIFEGEKIWSLENYRHSTHFNCADFSNDFFTMIDTMGVGVARRYYLRTKNPQSEFDKFLNDRGYIADDYLCDIVGTQYLRKMHYSEALYYFKKVRYRDHLNMSMTWDPFSEKRINYEKQGYFKLDFANEMCSLEKLIAREKDANKKAQLMVKYAIAIRNSFGFCWELTQYYKGEREYLPFERYAPLARKKIEEIVSKAMGMVSDYNVASELNYQLCNFKTVAEEYPETEKGRLVRGECDKLIDYHAEQNIK